MAGSSESDASDGVPVNGPLSLHAEYDAITELEDAVTRHFASRTPAFRPSEMDHVPRRSVDRSHVKRRMYEADERTAEMIADDMSTITIRCSTWDSGCPFLVYAEQPHSASEWIVKAFVSMHSDHPPPEGRVSRFAKRRRAVLADSTSGDESGQYGDGEYDKSDTEAKPRRRRRNSTASPGPSESPPRKPVAGPSRKGAKPKPKPTLASPIRQSAGSPAPAPEMPPLHSCWPTVRSFEKACAGAAKASDPPFGVLGGKNPTVGLVKCEYWKLGCPFRIDAIRSDIMQCWTVNEGVYYHAAHPPLRTAMMTPESEPSVSGTTFTL